MDIQVSERAREAREFLLETSDLAQATELANLIIGEVLDRFNQAIDGDIPGLRTHSGTSMVARVLLVRAILGTTSAWWTDIMPALPNPVIHEALLSIMLDLPVELETHCFKEGEEGE